MILTTELKEFVKSHENDDIHTLALQAHRFPDIDFALAIQQIKGRQIAKTKIPEWYKNEDIIYPKHLSLEQSSSEYTARYKASLFSGQSFADITGGMGIDFYYIAQRFSNSTYIEQQEELASIANHNFTVLGLNKATIKNEDGVDYLKTMSTVDLLYIDPARRDDVGKKIFLIEDCTPNILEIETLIEQKSRYAMIKLSPMLDITLASGSLKNISDIHIVSHNNECKELLFIKNNEIKVEQTKLHCVNINKEGIDIFTFTKEEESNASINYTSQVGKYLYEPNASIMKAGSYKSIIKQFVLNKLHISSHLYTSDTLYDDFHGRIFQVEQVCSFNKNDIKQHLSGIKQANIATRNFPLSVQELRKKLKINDGGSTYIFATTLANDKKVLIICRKSDK
jgi:hypothetical protein